MNDPNARLRRAVISDLIAGQARHRGDHPAIIASNGDKRRVVGYRELNVLADGIAESLAARGVGRGDIVAMPTATSILAIATYLAVMKVGAAFTPLDPAATQDDLTYLLDLTKPRVIVCDAAGGGNIPAAHRSSVMEMGEPVVATSSDAGWAPSPPFDAPVGEDDPAMIIFTSGTESRPKGVVVTHRNFRIATTPAWISDGYVERDDRFLLVAPIHTMAGLGTCTNLLSIGATVVIPGSTSPTTVLNAISTIAVTNMSQTPTFYVRLVRTPEFEDADLSSLKQCHTYGGVVPVEAIEAIRRRNPDIRFATYWGQSELSQLGAIGWYSSPAEIPDGDPRWIGKVLPTIDFRVVDDTGADTATGELWCRSPAVMAGYFNDPERTSETLRDGWLRTGDIVRVDDDGNLFFIDRKKDMIKTGGINVSSLEVEEALLKHPEVSLAAVFGVADPEWSEAVAAAVVLEAGASVTADALRAAVRDQLVGYKVPKQIIFVTEIPHDAQGKVVKRELRSLFGG